MGRVPKTILCVILCLGVLCLSFSVYAVEEPAVTTDPAGDIIQDINETVMSYYIWLMLRSWGIEIQYNDMAEFNDFVDSLIINWVLEYLESLPSAYTISTWIAPWQASADYWGNFQFNNSALEDIQDFANWLVDKFSLTDNSIHQLDGTMSANGATVFESNTLYASQPYRSVSTSQYPNGKTAFMGMAIANNFQLNENKKPYWFVMYNTTTDSYLYVFFKQIGETVQNPNSYIALREDTGALFNLQGYTTSWPNLNKSGYEFGYVEPYRGGDGEENLPNTFTPIVYNHTNTSPHNYITDWVNSLASFSVIYENSQRIVVTENIIPEEGTDYEPGDSIQIVDNTPIYINLEWDGEVTVSNLPAIVSTGTISDPELGNLFSWIPTFVDMASDSMEFFKQVVYMMPDQVLVCIFAVMGAGVLFGILRLMREH